jgi:hypothetical protein
MPLPVVGRANKMSLCGRISRESYWCWVGMIIDCIAGSTAPGAGQVVFHEPDTVERIGSEIETAKLWPNQHGTCFCHLPNRDTDRR